MVTKAEKRSVADHSHSRGMVVMTERQFRQNPKDFLGHRKAKKQVGIRGRDGKINVVVGTGGKSREERESDLQELEKLREQLD